jgi:hypothetical protein
LVDVSGTIHRGNFQAFKKAYEEAKQKKLSVFMFEGHEVLVTFAKYVIEYLEEKDGP